VVHPRGRVVRAGGAQDPHGERLAPIADAPPRRDAALGEALADRLEELQLQLDVIPELRSGERCEVIDVLFRDVPRPWRRNFAAVSRST